MFLLIMLFPQISGLENKHTGIVAVVCMVIISIVPGIGCKDTGGLLVVMASPVKRTKLQSLRLWPISKLLPIPL